MSGISLLIASQKGDSQLFSGLRKRRESWSVLNALFQLGSISNKELFQQRYNRMTTNIRLRIQRLERRAKLTGSGHKAIEFRIDISGT